MVGIISDRTKSIDRTLRSLASDFRRSNIKSTRAGESQPNEAAEMAKKKLVEAEAGSGVLWGDPTKQTAKIGNHEIKVRAARSVAGESVGMNTQGIGKGPRVGSYMRDHENLKIEK